MITARPVARQRVKNVVDSISLDHLAAFHYFSSKLPAIAVKPTAHDPSSLSNLCEEHGLCAIHLSCQNGAQDNAPPATDAFFVILSSKTYLVVMLIFMQYATFPCF